MKYAGIIYNDFSAAPGVSLSFFTQGCPHRCLGCHNPETWNFDEGKEVPKNILEIVLNGLIANNITRNFCLMGGEPLCKENLELSLQLVSAVRQKFPNIKIYIWSGYTIEQLEEKNDLIINKILSLSDVLIDGLFIESKKNLTLPLRGSSNQRIIDLTKR